MAAAQRAKGAAAASVGEKESGEGLTPSCLGPHCPPRGLMNQAEQPAPPQYVQGSLQIIPGRGKLALTPPTHLFLASMQGDRRPRQSCSEELGGEGSQHYQHPPASLSWHEKQEQESRCTCPPAPQPRGLAEGSSIRGDKPRCQQKAGQGAAPAHGPASPPQHQQRTRGLGQGLGADRSEQMWP